MAGTFSLEPSEEQQLLAQTARDFAVNKLRPVAHAADEKSNTAADVLAQAWELGLTVGAIPEQYGGAGMPRSAITGALLGEELAWGDLAHTLAAFAPALVAYPVADYGTEQQKAELLPALAAPGNPVATAAVVEPSMDWDPAQPATRFREDGDGYVLSGRKCFVPLGSTAKTFLVYASSGEPGFGNVQGFLVPRSARGLSVSDKEKNMGVRALDTVELGLDAVRVPKSARLGGDKGCSYERILSQSRVALAAMAVGVARSAFEHARAYALDRKAFGEPIASKQSVAFMVADMAVEIDAARLLVWEAAWHLDRGEVATKETYLAKLYADSMVLKVTDNAVQVLGGHGYIRENLVEGWLRHARGFAMFDGLALV